MVGHQAGVGCPARQRHLLAAGVDHKAVLVVFAEQAAHIADVVQQAGDDDMRVIVRAHVGVQRAAAHDVVSRQRDEHGVLDIVIQRVAVADTFQRDAGGIGTISTSGVCAEEKRRRI